MGIKSVLGALLIFGSLLGGAVGLTITTMLNIGNMTIVSYLGFGALVAGLMLVVMTRK
jgi:hypothetical protein